MDHSIGGGQVEPDSPRFERDQEHWRPPLLKALHQTLPLSGLSCQLEKVDPAQGELVFDELQHARKLAEHEHASPRRNHRLEQLEEQLKLRTLDPLSPLELA